MGETSNTLLNSRCGTYSTEISTNKGIIKDVRFLVSGEGVIENALSAVKLFAED